MLWPTCLPIGETDHDVRPGPERHGPVEPDTHVGTAVAWPVLGHLTSGSDLVFLFDLGIHEREPEGRGMRLQDAHRFAHHLGVLIRTDTAAGVNEHSDLWSIRDHAGQDDVTIVSAVGLAERVVACPT